jgi:hypothetical protein
LVLLDAAISVRVGINHGAPSCLRILTAVVDRYPLGVEVVIAAARAKELLAA